jgi:molybdenum cofactor cytidylyltransferase
MTLATNLSPIAAVIAAAGRSTRMGTPKQLLPWGASTVIATVVHKLTLAGAQPVICVVGHRQAEVIAALAATSAQTVANPEYASSEMLTSYQVGVRALQATACSGTLIALGDQPHIPVAVIQQIIEQAQRTPDSLVIPSYNLRRGHPFYLPRRSWAELLALGSAQSLRTLVARHSEQIIYANVESAAILQDMDTVDEYTKLTTERAE